MMHRFARRMAPAAWAAVLCLVGAIGTRAETTSIAPGTEVPLEFAQSVSTKTAHKGDEIRLRVSEDVRVNGQTVIPRGAPATGIVESVKRAGSFGRRGELKIRLSDVRDARGDRVPLDEYKSGDRFSAGGPAASGAGLLILGPIGLVGGAFVKG